MRYKRADWKLLKQWATEGLVRVLYLDESGFEQTSPLTYSYVKRGQQFDYGRVVGGFNRDRDLTLMHWQAERAKAHWQATEQITVIVQDGASFH
ncbi:hypothetical protein [Trichothermofontia sp.]